MTSEIFSSRKLVFRFIGLVKSPFFWLLTIVGHLIIFAGAFLLYHFEGQNQKMAFDFLDALLWSVGIVTTIGYGDYIAITVAGKVVLYVLMMLGTLFIWAYMAIFVTGLISPELAKLEKDVHDVEKDVHGVEKEIQQMKPKKS